MNSDRPTDGATDRPTKWLIESRARSHVLTSSLIDAQNIMIEKVNNNPLSWAVATKFQKLKRARTDDEDDKLFAAAEKKLKDERKAKKDEAKLKAQTSREDLCICKVDLVKCADKLVLTALLNQVLLCWIREQQNRNGAQQTYLFSPTPPGSTAIKQRTC